MSISFLSRLVFDTFERFKIWRDSYNDSAAWDTVYITILHDRLGDITAVLIFYSPGRSTNRLIPRMKDKPIKIILKMLFFLMCFPCASSRGNFPGLGWCQLYLYCVFI